MALPVENVDLTYRGSDPFTNLLRVAGRFAGKQRVQREDIVGPTSPDMPPRYKEGFWDTLYGGRGAALNAAADAEQYNRRAKEAELAKTTDEKIREEAARIEAGRKAQSALNWEHPEVDLFRQRLLQPGELDYQRQIGEFGVNNYINQLQRSIDPRIEFQKRFDTQHNLTTAELARMMGSLNREEAIKNLGQKAAEEAIILSGGAGQLAMTEAETKKHQADYNRWYAQALKSGMTPEAAGNVADSVLTNAIQQRLGQGFKVQNGEVISFPGVGSISSAMTPGVTTSIRPTQAAVAAGNAALAAKNAPSAGVPNILPPVSKAPPAVPPSTAETPKIPQGIVDPNAGIGQKLGAIADRSIPQYYDYVKNMAKLPYNIANTVISTTADPVAAAKLGLY